MKVVPSVRKIVEWYSSVAYGRWDGGACLPFYCDPKRVGAFAVPVAELAQGSERALFKLLVTFALYQSRRDVDIMALQRSMPRRAAASLADHRRLKLLIHGNPCQVVNDAGRFDACCSVRRDPTRGRATCDLAPKAQCHVKEASLAIRRMGDMGKIPTSAFLHLRSWRGFSGLLSEVRSLHRDPRERARALVARFAHLHRIGTKLATMFVSALSTEQLAAGLTPWVPDVVGSELVVIDANVARTIEILDPGTPRRYEAQEAWVTRIAAQIDLRRVRRTWPRFSPRLVQQAIYLFRSRSNRAAHHDPCATRPAACDLCVPTVCPWMARSRRS